MRLLDVLNAPWAILPEKLLEIREIYFTHLRGEKIDVRAIEARLGQPLNNKRVPYTVTNSVTVLPIEGVIAKRMNLFTRISGGTSTQILASDLQAALDDPRAHSILLHIDSPGGQVDGTQEMARLIRDARSRKPVFALGDGMMTSAAYWIASAADRVFIAGDTTQVGSIGVLATHTDISRAEEMRGIKTTEITAGKYKRIASEHAPLTPDGRASIQEQVDHIYSVFVNEIARHRGANVETVLDKMADGRIFLGKKAIDAGLVDGVSTLDGAIAQLNQERNDARRAVARQILTERREAWKAKR
jgi:signal peptide peptidase SppA